MTQINEPYYDTDPANKAYVDRVNGKTVAFVGTKSKNFGIRPEPPYHVNDTYMDGSDIYICIKDRELGSFDPSDWKLATAYTNDDVANSKNRVFITQPEPPYNKGDLWTTGPNGELRRCVNSRATGSYVESDWENATSYDSTHTVIENGLVTAGTIQVVNGGTVAAGITGNESGDNAVRFWAGATSGNKNNAPFRVTQGGKLYAYDADITGGKINLHGARGETLFKITIDGFETSSFVELSNHYIRTRLEHDSGTVSSVYMGNTTGTGFEAVIENTDDTIDFMQAFADLIWIHRIDGSNIGGTMIRSGSIDTPKITAGNIDAGTCTLDSALDTNVAFNKVFSKPPIVMLTCTQNLTPVNAVYVGSVIETRTTGFTAFCMTNGTPTTNQISFNWFAIEP